MCLSLGVACSSDDIQNVINNNTNIQLETPTNLYVKDVTLRWNSVEYASGYTILINGTTTETSQTNSFSLRDLSNGTYTLAVKANGDGVRYKTSPYSDSISYVRDTDTGEEYYDSVEGAFGSFDEVNTKNSFLGYGIDIINASAITSKNVLMTYPIFDMNKLMSETLLKSNEHYNSFETIEGMTIEDFSENMGNSKSITAGVNVSAKGNLIGVNVGASASLSAGLATSFTRTTEDVVSQHFLEIIAENQSYWLILQTSEARYREILSTEFKQDLYNKSITPAQLFNKYGTHLLTSVAMGGNICMYYTMYSTLKETTRENYSEVSAALKANVEAAYGGASAGIGGGFSFEEMFNYRSLALQYGIQVDKTIVSAGGGSFGINNESTLYEKYYDWQKSLDAYPVVIGIKDTNSLYPIWQLLDLNIEGADERYQELYNYFQKYGSESYNKLCETYSITPSIAPSSIENIKVGSIENYKNQTIQVSAGDTMEVSFDVLPENANKYVKTYSVDDTSLATIDKFGLLTILPTAKGGSYITVTITAGSVSKHVTLYVINSYNVSFNTRVNGLNIDPIYGVLEGYSIEEPNISREGYVLEGWYKDPNNTEIFDFDLDFVYSNMTLYAKWKAIKPIVTFDSVGGSEVDSSIIAYNSTVLKPKQPTKTGYIFGGWFEDEECTILFDFAKLLKEDITLYAKWNKIEYTISFVTNGGTEVAPMVTSIEEGYKIIEPNTVKTYYLLEGWYKDANLLQKFYFETEITQDTTLYAKWKTEKSYVEFVDFDGESCVYNEFGFEIETQSTDVERNFKVSEVQPYKEGYTFVGWYLNGIKIDLKEFAEFKPQESVYRLYAKWNVNSYNLTYILDGEEYYVESYEYGETIMLLDVSMDGYEFGGWKNGNKQIPSTMPSKDVELTGALILKTFSLSYYVDGTLYTSQNYKYGEVINYIANPTNTQGKVFLGWSYANGELPTTMPAESIRIDGGFEQVKFIITYYVDNQVERMVEVIKGYQIPTFQPCKTGYSFGGWLVNGQMELPSVMPAENLNVYGTFTINSYTITFDSDGGSQIDAITSEYESEIIKPANPTKEGYTFVGWNVEIPSNMPAKDLEIKALWQINICTITFNTNGGSFINSINGEYGMPVTKPADPIKEGYTFVGWSVEVPSSMPAKDLEIMALWQVNLYTITFDTVGGSQIDAITSEYGSTIIKPANPTKEGYTFAGWSPEIPTTMPAKDVKITANWTINSYMLDYKLNVDNYSGEFNVVGEIQNAKYGVTSTINVARSESFGDFYLFKGWYSAPTGGLQISDSNGQLIKNVSGYTDLYGKWSFTSSEAVKLYAQWEITSNSISFKSNSEKLKGSFNLVNTITAKHGSTKEIGVAKATTYSKYYVFKGWFTSATGGIQIAYASGKLVSSVSGYTDSNGKWNRIIPGTVTLYAQWAQSYVGYTYIETPDEVVNLISKNLAGNYVLIKDIDMKGKTPASIGTSSTPFSGIIDGDGHKLTNLTISVSADMNSNRAYGFVNYLTGTIRNLTISGAKYSVEANNSTGVKSTRLTILGPFAGDVWSKGVVENCTTTNSEINCYARSDHGPDSQWKFVFVGGVVGSSTGKIRNCSVSDSKITGTGAVKYDGQYVEASVGGVAGYLKGGSITGCKTNNVTVTSKGCSWGDGANRAYDAYSNAGGIAGLMNKNAALQSGNSVNGGARTANLDIAYSYSKGYSKTGVYVACTQLNSSLT